MNGKRTGSTGTADGGYAGNESGTAEDDGASYAGRTADGRKFCRRRSILENLTQVMQYGAGTQKKMADFSDQALKNVRSQDLGEVGDLLTG